MFEGISFTTYHLQLETGDKLLFFTDGLCDLRNDQGKRFGRERIVQTFRNCAHLSGHEIRAQFINTLDSHGDLDAPDDDILFSIFEVL
jgi:sigma-B regulation protein RsbU (phosphoserine phosphatase)